MAVTRRLLPVACAVAWLFTVLVSYYTVHKPFSSENFLAVMNVLGDVAVWLGLVALAGSLGHRLLRGFTFASPLEAVTFRIGLGWGVISFATFGLGLVGALNRLLFWAILILALLVFRADLRLMWRDLEAIGLPIGARFESGLMLFMIATLCLAMLTTLAPTLAWDAQLYHLLAGKLALAQGRILAPPDIPSLSDPALIEMLYLAAMVLKSDGSTGLIHLGFAVLTVGALFAFSQRYFSARAGWVAGAILLAVPSFMLLATWQYNDAALAFYAFAALYAVVVAKENLELRWFGLAGAIVGLALGIKYTAEVIPLALVVLLWFARKSLSLRHWALILTMGAVVASPWYLRNLAFVGNPIYPFLFGGKYWDSFRAYWYGLFGTGLLNEPLRLLIAPWEATILGQEGKASYEATVGPLLLAFLPLLVFVWRSVEKERVVRDLLTFVVIVYFFWLGGLAISRSLIQTRLMFPALPPLSLLTALALERVSDLDLAQFSLARFARVSVGLVLALTLLGQTMDFVKVNPLSYLAGFETREEYLSQRLTPGYWDALKFIGGLSAPKVLFLWEPRAYYAPSSAQVQEDEILDNFRRLRFQYHDAAGISQALRAQGYTHLLLARWGLDFELADMYGGLSLDDVITLRELTSLYAQRVYGTMPLDYTVDADGKITVLSIDREPYSIYALK